ncbi:hypothetical protein 162322550 [Organic Lake phycodnavirus 1]|nr:hypothetical protein 162322550 [Organic Lake phycodnavirus 1]
MRFDEDILKLDRLIKQLEQNYKNIQLDPLYIPNSYDHFMRWSKSGNYNTSNVFKGKYRRKLRQSYYEYKHIIQIQSAFIIRHRCFA